MLLSSRWSPVAYPRDTSITEHIFKGAQKFGSKIALVDGATGDTLTYGQVILFTKRIGSFLVKHGVKAHDVVTIFLQNDIYYPVIMHAIVGIGATASPSNPLSTAYELSKQLSDSKSQFIFTHPQFHGTVQKACTNNGIKHVWVLGDNKWKEMLSDDQSAWPRTSVIKNPKEHIAVLPYSSGTTGVPKGVMLSHLNLVAHEEIISKPEVNLPTTGDVHVFPMPMFHIYGAFAVSSHALRMGIKVVLMSRFDLKQWLSLTEKYKATWLYIVPPIAVMLAKSPEVLKYDLSSVKVLFCGAAPLGEDTQKEVKERLPKVRVAQGYGMTESSPILTVDSMDSIVAGSAGCVVPNTMAKVVDIETGKELGPNIDGELCFKGPQVMVGYLNKPDVTAFTIRNGWLHTGDIGHYDKTGHIFVVDRLKELIKYKGFQVAPSELETLILTHPAIQDTCVVGVSDTEAGELPKAYCVKKKGHESVSAQDIIQHVAERCSPHKRLRGGVEFLPEIPKTASGKLLRRLLRERGKHQSKL